MSLTPEQLYVRLGTLLQEVPSFATGDFLSPEEDMWLARAVALLEASNPNDAVEAKHAVKRAHTTTLGFERMQEGGFIVSVLRRALARTELQVPASAQGAFIPAGDVYEAFAAVGKILGAAQIDVFLVDPYADEKLLGEYAAQAPEGISVRVLTDDKRMKATLVPATRKWQQQYGDERPLEVRTSTTRVHDRLIIIDRATAYMVGQSFKDLAVDAPTTISRTADEIAKLKIESHEEMWNSGHDL